MAEESLTIRGLSGIRSKIPTKVLGEDNSERSIMAKLKRITVLFNHKNNIDYQNTVSDSGTPYIKELKRIVEDLEISLPDGHRERFDRLCLESIPRTRSDNALQ